MEGELGCGRHIKDETRTVEVGKRRVRNLGENAIYNESAHHVESVSGPYQVIAFTWPRRFRAVDIYKSEYDAPKSLC